MVTFSIRESCRADDADEEEEEEEVKRFPRNRRTGHRLGSLERMQPWSKSSSETRHWPREDAVSLSMELARSARFSSAQPQMSCEKKNSFSKHFFGMSSLSTVPAFHDTVFCFLAPRAGNLSCNISSLCFCAACACCAKLGNDENEASRSPSFFKFVSDTVLSKVLDISLSLSLWLLNLPNAASSGFGFPINHRIVRTVRCAKYREQQSDRQDSIAFL